MNEAMVSKVVWLFVVLLLLLPSLIGGVFLGSAACEMQYGTTS